MTARNAEFYSVDIRAYSAGVLSVLEFEGATKRNRPDLRVGATIYCRVSRLSPHLQPELSCVSPFHKKSWSSGEAFFGELDGGLLLQVSKGMQARLLQTNVRALELLGSVLQFEITVGMNGRVWVKGDSIRANLVVANLLRKGEEGEARLEELAKGVVA